MPDSTAAAQALTDVQVSRETTRLFTSMSPQQLAERNQHLRDLVAAKPTGLLLVYHTGVADPHHRAGRRWPATGQAVELASDRIGEIRPEKGVGLPGGVLRIDRGTLDELMTDPVFRIIPGANV